MFSRSDALWFSDAVRSIYSAQSLAEFVNVTTGAIYDQFRLVASGCEELGPGASSYILHGGRFAVQPPANHAIYLHDNPFAPLIGSRRMPLLLHMRSDVSFAKWCRTDHYNGLARPMDWHDMLFLMGQTEPTLFAITLTRDTMFSPRESDLAGLLRPHCTAAWRRLQPPAQSARGAPPQRIVLSPDLRPIILSAETRAILRSYFPRWRVTSELPADLKAWAAHSLRCLREEPWPHPLRAFAIEAARGRLLVRCFPASQRRAAGLFLVESPALPDFFQLARLGLTERECEVLHWLAQGKRDAEIALILAIAPKTVSKHVENLLRKLRAENRSAAVSTARAWLACEN